MASYNFLAVAGSLRQASYHRLLVNNLQALAPEDVTIEVFDLEGIPLFNEDIETLPERVKDLLEALERSQGSIWATPEYNGAMSGVIKNAIDWASPQKFLAQRPATVISASPGALGATKAQESLRAVLNHLGMHVLARPSLAIPRVHEKFQDGTIHDEATEAFLRAWLLSFRGWVAQLEK